MHTVDVRPVQTLPDLLLDIIVAVVGLRVWVLIFWFFGLWDVVSVIVWLGFLVVDRHVLLLGVKDILSRELLKLRLLSTNNGVWFLSEIIGDNDHLWVLVLRLLYVAPKLLLSWLQAYLRTWAKVFLLIVVIHVTISFVWCWPPVICAWDVGVFNWCLNYYFLLRLLLRLWKYTRPLLTLLLKRRSSDDLYDWLGPGHWLRVIGHT